MAPLSQPYDLNAFSVPSECDLDPRDAIACGQKCTSARVGIRVRWSARKVWARLLPPLVSPCSAGSSARSKPSDDFGPAPRQRGPVCLCKCHTHRPTAQDSTFSHDRSSCAGQRRARGNLFDQHHDAGMRGTRDLCEGTRQCRDRRPVTPPPGGRPRGPSM